MFWYLSYAIESGENDDGFRGGVVVEAVSFLAACAESKRRGLSPGGQVHGEPVPPVVSSDPRFAQYVNRLMNKEQTIAFLKAFDGEPHHPDGTKL
jgi:hypothetical protein